MREWINDWLGGIVGAILIALGVWGIWKAPEHSIRHQVAEAAFIAGVLTITVDPFLKRRLLKEASKDIFHHMLGFGLPPEIRNRLRDIALKTTLYRKDMESNCTFEHDANEVRIEFEYRFEVVNPSNHKASFNQRLEFEKHERAVLRSVSCSTQGNRYGKGATLTPRKDDEVMIWEGPSVGIPPATSGLKTVFTAAYSVTRPLPDFHTQHFVQPTIGFSLRVRKKPVDLKVTASPADPPHCQDQWIYKQLFMPGEHIEMRWEQCKDSQ
jgi:hypothetical protein